MSGNGKTLKERMSASMPPEGKVASVIGDKLVDFSAIVGLVLLAIFTKLDPYFAAAVIALIAGVSLGETLKGRGGPSSIVLALGYAIMETAKRFKGAAVLIVLLLGSCGSSAGAYVPALLSDKPVCEVKVEDTNG